MSSYKALMNSLSNDSTLRKLTDEESRKLRKVFITAFRDLSECCERNGPTLMLIGGSALGAVRHHGFIPWDDDMDVAMPREDYEILKTVFEEELGENYILSSPNYKHNASERFPKMLVRNTLFAELGGDARPELSKIKIDIFIIENIPQNTVQRYLKGVWCTILMGLASYEGSYEEDSSTLRDYLCKTKEGAKIYKRRKRIGRLLSFKKRQEWLDIVDANLQYKKKTNLMGIPSGRGHYFGEICARTTFLPVSKGTFEGLDVNLPGNPQAYLSNLYGTDFMTVPPKDKQERHFIVDIKFREDLEKNG